MLNTICKKSNLITRTLQFLTSLKGTQATAYMIWDWILKMPNPKYYLAKGKICPPEEKLLNPLLRQFYFIFYLFTFYASMLSA